ncbi:MAG: hypothetical protein S4CHLAM20_06000 [Chlamydiia bacterium]|nr:hypothetical protein [Chlamydiia bacterium]
MIVSGIPFRTWKKTIQIITGFFLLVSLITPLLALTFYLFETDFDYFFAKSPHLKQKATIQRKPSPIQKEITIFDDTKKPYIPNPEITDFINFTHYNARPDANFKTEKTIALSSHSDTIYAKQNIPIFLNCSDLSSITFSKAPTPYSFIPLKVTPEGLVAKFHVEYRNKKNDIIYQSSEEVFLKKTLQEPTKLKAASKRAFDSLEGSSCFAPDKLIGLDKSSSFDKKRKLFRLCINKNKDSKPLFIKKGDKLSFQNNKWVINPKSTQKKPLLIISSVNDHEIKATYYTSNGFFQHKLLIPIHQSSSKSLHEFKFDEVYKRNKTSVIGKIKGKTFILKENDWLVKKESLWKHMTSTQEFDDLLDLKQNHEILVCEKIKEKKNQDYFVGYLFDTTRSNYRKLEIPLKKNKG